jgi:SAM-dependent methyltransferase
MSILKCILPDRLKKNILRIYYLGTKYYCNCCQSSLRILKSGGSQEPVIKKFKITGAGYRESDYCPVCKSTLRDRLVWLYLENTLKDRTFGRILHIAPEKQLSVLLREIKNVEYKCGDINPVRYQNYAPAEYINLESIKYEDDFFDLVICNHVLEHIIDDQHAMREIYRVLKPGGVSILQVPLSNLLEETYEDFEITSEDERAKTFGQKDHVRIYGKDYINRLINAGFKVNVIPSITLLNKSVNKNTLVDLDESLYICTKV